MTAAHTSDILKSIVSEPSGSLSVELILRRLEDRAIGLVILLVAMSNMVPSLPGFSLVSGLPILWLAWQMIQGRPYIPLPQKVANRQVSLAQLKLRLDKIMPALLWIERYLCPRLDKAFAPSARRMLGVLFLLLALMMMLPVGHFPPAFAMALLALGMVEMDGLFVAYAAGFAVVVMFFMAGSIGVFFKSLAAWTGR